jgi:hemin uptake protein HemP
MNSYTPSNHLSFRRAISVESQPRFVHRPVEQTVRVVTSDNLFRGTHEIGIEHGGAMYRLKITRQGKLILNK